ncbi:MAG: PBP1A family penicillin-binding protein [Alphaproteobacteria bacterium]|nr:PBP1A family penicillin-binding protein [Alphaproteobacteria bacterium]
MEHDLFKQQDAPLVAEPRERIVASLDEERPARARQGGGIARLALHSVAFVFGVGILGVVAFAAFAALYLNKLNQDLPNYQVLADYAPPVTTRVYAGDGSLVAEFARERRIFVPIEAIPTLVKEAFISAEDKKFYEHDGVDMRGVLRAQIANVGNVLNGRRLEGGSTITQQVAKNFLLTSEQKVERKLREWLIARRIERTYSKDKILELYLNEIYLGNRSYGVAAAALNYFDKSLDELTLEEVAYLAAIPKGPSNYHPVRYRERATERRNWVIGRMVEDGKVSASVGAAARAAPLDAEIAPPLGARDWAAEYFAEEVRKEVADRYGAEALYDGGLAIRTTLEPALQDLAGRTLRKWLVAYDRRHGWRGPIDTVEAPGDEPEALSVAFDALVDHPKIVDDLAPWRPAIVLSADQDTATIALGPEARGVIPLDQLKWARKYVSADSLGPEVKSTADVLARGDVVYVSPVRESTAAQVDEVPTSEEDAAAAEGGPPPETDDGAIADDPFADDIDQPQKMISGMPVFSLQQTPAVNGALVALDPHTGRVLAMVGGFSFQLSEFNRAVQAQRQPGSTFKPFVYAAALDNGYTPSSIVLDAPFVAPSIDSWWKPGNYVAGRFYGESTLRLGIEQSRNTMTARLAQEIGIGRIVEYANRFNLADRLPRELAISLGSGETTLMRITAGYSTFVNGGKSVRPFIVDRIQNRTGETIYREDQRVCEGCDSPVWEQQSEPSLADSRDQVIDPRTAYQMVSMLEGVVKRGTGSRVRRVVNKPVAGKTGTTNEYKDAWFVGFAPDLAVGVFVGFDLPDTLGQGEAGGIVAAPIFGDFMSTALADTPGLPFRVPSGIRLVRVNAKSGRPAGPGEGNVILEAFKAEDAVGGERPYDRGLDFDPLTDGSDEEAAANGDDLSGLY